jgi:hypothetical protein
MFKMVLSARVGVKKRLLMFTRDQIDEMTCTARLLST